ncbi:transcriptional repressor LexA [Desulfosporosinus sp. BICA1-9]|uniref:transcriptional repressor LexA n=1 Tax=Desulfosporosinus sp. BICA1-9 TaxID=1531958 RepID=UPI00054B7620|nr:transcriptional repressor LexA [Desulfosporosinus sp. BICA1-9]KJS47247.1 MAG: LexA family transcriptional regulator [Peptococcaceae bacterium BRH_c23]KJS88504.1 MAG: LexA family transcriptional regulator [Desulfosporosinus sp. BICA1-9]HBW34648.1 transcriptional repressor LexA [Desulfosporosinus sp.]
MYPDLSMRQTKILEFIKEEIRKKGYPPAVREIGEAVGLLSSSTVHGHLQTLEEKGYIRRDPTKPRAIEILDSSIDPIDKQKAIHVPIVGRVTAGQPILAVENIEGTFPLPDDLVRQDNVFMLKVQGDSMIEAGILDGDYIIVRQQNVARNGEIVVALIGDEATVKRFFKERTLIRLQPENSAMEPIYSQDVSILGKVVGVFRTL